MTNRRSFIKKAVLGTAALSIPSYATYASNQFSTVNSSTELKISLAQWSLNRAFFKGDLNANHFASIARNTYGIGAIEFVNAFYKDYGKSEKFWMQMKNEADNEGVKNLLIMIDDEGELGNPDDAERNTAVENHYKWIHAAKILGCHSIRVNAFGAGEVNSLRTALVNGLGELAAYGKSEDINVLIENHGLHTSNGAFITSIIKEVGNPYLGTLPDFGNWCLNAKWGSTQNNKCTEIYDRYKGVSEFLPYAKGVSAKSYAFDNDGNETIIDYKKMLQIVKDSGFDGYIGIEFEGENMSEPEGIRATQALIERVWGELN